MATTNHSGSLKRNAPPLATFRAPASSSPSTASFRAPASSSTSTASNSPTVASISSQQQPSSLTLHSELKFQNKVHFQKYKINFFDIFKSTKTHFFVISKMGKNPFLHQKKD